MLVPFGAGEEMRTEISTKFLRPGLEGIYAEAGSRAHRLVEDQTLEALPPLTGLAAPASRQPGASASISSSSLSAW